MRFHPPFHAVLRKRNFGAITMFSHVSSLCVCVCVCLCFWLRGFGARTFLVAGYLGQLTV